MSKVKKLALCALMTASSVVVMFLGSISGFLDICTEAVAALIVAFCSVEMGAGYGWLVYFASGAASLLILPAKEAAWSFALFFGIHALLIPLLSKLPRWASFVIRLLIMNATLVLIYLFFSELLQMPDAMWMKIAVFAMANAIFILSDMLYKRLLRIYFFKFRDKISKFLK